MLGQILTDAGTNEKDSLTDLQSAEQGTLARQQSSPWVSPWIGILWLLPAIALLLTLAATQRLLYRRSRRVLSKYLTMAAAAVIALCVVASHVIVLEHSFRMASGPLGAVITTQEFQTAHDDHEVETGLTGLIGKSCDQCEATQQAVIELVGDDATNPAVTSVSCTLPQCVTTEQDDYAQDVGTAEAGYGVSLDLIAILTVVLLLLIPLGLWRYLDEYRYRQA